jgi:polyhydroxyalkanoate synthesis repressor PhaR
MSSFIGNSLGAWLLRGRTGDYGAAASSGQPGKPVNHGQVAEPSENWPFLTLSARVAALRFATAAPPQNDWLDPAESGYAQLLCRGNATAMADEKEPITIKKYANRRLYNTGTSTYVTLEDLAAMVKSGEDFVVYDAKSSEDITRSVLAQIIFEQENKEGQSLLPIAFLRQLIRFYGDSMQMLVPRYLEQSMSSLTSQQDKFRQQLAQAFGVGGFGALEDQVRRNMEMFEKTFAMFVPFASGQKNAATDKPPSASGGSEMDELKRQIDEMQKRLDRLGKKE